MGGKGRLVHVLLYIVQMKKSIKKVPPVSLVVQCISTFALPHILTLDPALTH